MRRKSSPLQTRMIEHSAFIRLLSAILRFGRVLHSQSDLLRNGEHACDQIAIRGGRNRNHNRRQRRQQLFGSDRRTLASSAVEIQHMSQAVDARDDGRVQIQAALIP